MPTARPWRPLCAAVCLVAVLAATARAASGSASDLARQAMTACEQGRRAMARNEREAAFSRGQKLAEQAVAADDASAAAHFALFCNMGELMRIDGESISSVLSLRRLMAELDRTLALEPGHTDALAAKGTLLVRLPRILGGDVIRGEAMLRQVIVQDPGALATRLTLARTCEARGDREEAIALASRALQIARERGRTDKVAEAQAMLAKLQAGR